MTDTTTLKVSTRTRERLRSATPGTADDAINAALDALDRERVRRQIRQEAENIAADPADRREIAEIRDDMAYLAGGLT